ncbi:MAG: aminotransferase class I/II-fold pyridoxal phosphate-dependent enzyme [Ostreibacterium sp.]
MSKKTFVPQKSMLDYYYNSSQLRADSWNMLKNVSTQLTEKDLTIKEKTSYKNRAEALLKAIEPFEVYWGYPSQGTFNRIKDIFWAGDYEILSHEVGHIVRMLMSHGYRRFKQDSGEYSSSDLINTGSSELVKENNSNNKNRHPYFEVLIVDRNNDQHEAEEREGFNSIRRNQDSFYYEPVFVNSFEDAIIAVMFNHNIQSIVIRYDFPIHSKNTLGLLEHELLKDFNLDFKVLPTSERGALLAQIIKHFRPELDIFLVTDQSVEEIASKVAKTCRRIFYNTEDYLELHLNILRGIHSRYSTPFFSALKEYSKKPTGVFHAMPISRGKSIIKSNWIKDMIDFYGMNTFLAETSTTSGGLDSLLNPKGPIKEAQELASRAFGSQRTFFATNGTSTCNKIVVQALIQPNDIVLVDRDCHKSHHYGLMLSGAEVVYLDSYPLHQYSMYGAVPLKEIKQKILALKDAGKLDRVKMILLTNCTFDGVVYHVERYMQECLAIKPDLIFLWDEAWFGFARFGPTYRTRTAMYVAKKLKKKYQSPEYAQQYQQHMTEIANSNEPNTTPLLPAPDRVKIRAYSTQSTHKTLTSLRQGSMIHEHDQYYKSHVEEAFKEAYMTHTSTSPNYQILASLDIGRRQVELEGFELVSKQVEMAIILRQKIRSTAILNKHFKILDPTDMVPAAYKQSDIDYYDKQYSFDNILGAWNNDDFVLDATRITLYTGSLGIDGDTFKNTYLMDKYGIQINKTSRNTVLFMTNIGTTRSSIAYLLEVLVQIAEELENELEHASPAETRIYEKKVHNLTVKLPPLPDFSYFHAAFRADQSGNTPEGKIRDAFFLAYDASQTEYFCIDDSEIDEAIETDRELVSAGFVTPYPPGFPILVPGQVISRDILIFLRELDVKEIHGYRPELGLRVFTEEAINKNYKYLEGNLCQRN